MVVVWWWFTLVKNRKNINFDESKKSNGQVIDHTWPLNSRSLVRSRFSNLWVCLNSPGPEKVTNAELPAWAWKKATPQWHPKPGNKALKKYHSWLFHPYKRSHVIPILITGFWGPTSQWLDTIKPHRTAPCASVWSCSREPHGMTAWMAWITSSKNTQDDRFFLSGGFNPLEKC